MKNSKTYFNQCMEFSLIMKLKGIIIREMKYVVFSQSTNNSYHVTKVVRLCFYFKPNHGGI